MLRWSSADNRCETHEPSKPPLNRQCARPQRFGDAATAAVETSEWASGCHCRVIQWRKDARARGMQIGSRTYRDVKDRGRRRPDPFQAHWAEMLRCLQADPDQTALELLATFMAQYPGVYQMHHLRTLQRRVKAWRRDAVERLIGSMHEFTPSVSPEPCR